MRKRGFSSRPAATPIFCSLLGIRHFVLAINRWILSAFDEVSFRGIRECICGIRRAFSLQNLVAIPAAARFGDNVVHRSSRMPWYQEPSLLEHLESASLDEARPQGPLRMPVQLVSRPNADFRGYAGTIVSGALEPGTDLIPRSSVLSRVRGLSPWKAN